MVTGFRSSTINAYKVLITPCYSPHGADQKSARRVIPKPLVTLNPCSPTPLTLGPLSPKPFNAARKARKKGPQLSDVFSRKVFLFAAICASWSFGNVGLGLRMGLYRISFLFTGFCGAFLEGATCRAAESLGLGFRVCGCWLLSLESGSTITALTGAGFGIKVRV